MYDKRSLLLIFFSFISVIYSFTQVFTIYAMRWNKNEKEMKKILVEEEILVFETENESDECSK